MAIVHPTYDDFIELIRAELRRQIPTIDPTVTGSWARGFTDGTAALANVLDLTLRDLEKQLFPQTASGAFLDLWGGYEDLERNPASSATGFVSIPGTTSTVIPAGVVFAGATSQQYATDAVTTITDVMQSITQISRVGTLATATTSAAHNLATGLLVDVTGSAEANFNQTDASIAVLSDTMFSYNVADAGSILDVTPGIEYASTFASAQVTALFVGDETNADAGGILNLVNPFTGIDGPAYVQIDGLQGGADIETDEFYRARIILSRSIVEGVFTEDQVVLAALDLAGNTRAFVKRPTVGAGGGALDPFPGQVAVYVMRDGDANPIPTPAILADTKVLVLANGALPAHTAEADVFVEGPTPVITDFTFSALDPNTPEMQTAIDAQLEAFFQDEAQFETDVTENAYISAIQSTQTLSGAFVNSFALSAPVGDIVVGAGGIAVKGAVTF